MDTRTQFLLELLDKVGAPLTGAVSIRSSNPDAEAQDAQTVASLLSESVKMGIALSQSMNLKTGDGDADAIRVALSALSGGMVADFYKNNGRVPAENDTRRMVKALESVIVFADNFTPAAEHAGRLATLESVPPFFDAVQTNIYAMHALLPAISAIADFSFGQSETRLIQDVSDRLGARAKEILSMLPPDANAMSELVILSALGRIYAAAHISETARLKAAGPDAQQEADISTVWSSFERQAVMLEVLTSSMGGLGGASGRGGGGVKPAVSAPEEPAAPPPPSPAAPVQQAGGSPMSFFKKK